MFFVTHDIEEAVALSDTIVVINGRPEQSTSDFGLICLGLVPVRIVRYWFGKNGC
ncbi:MAG: hypothetical protein JO275_12500 [Verrucomicrobia bacterium]|nr:hypothetical protein [Verrucomicrobiota bacterium]